ncbi:DNA ligase D [Pigmentiphaga aceris]|uniref:DNA ligase (ATP) n=1 Tax=Pigmentiphaga aceris TaxID=1940612 RepID=A0A5C0B4Q0_9BURK|nr:non-homologous end-joining DNA ligase [Pigmentiphaga aceris]QEI08836.1 DNA ligase D [Pigmentiphaga aceris]
MPDALQRYRDKRDFSLTSEPQGGRAKKGAPLSFVVQKHAARNLHYDFRLELDGSLKSWAVPKGPSLDPADKRMAVHVEDHPLDYGSFEGTIPPGQYGAGTVIVWDRGTWTPVGDAREGYAAGKLKFALDGEKLRGHWTLVRMRPRAGEKQEAWLLIKEKDDEAKAASAFNVVDALPDSVLNGSTVERPATSAQTGAKKATKKSAKQAAPAATSAAKKPSTKKAAATSQADTPLPAKAVRAEQRAAKAAASADSTRTTTAPSKTKPNTATLPAGATKAKLPLTLSPQLATLVDRAPADTGWIYEMKFDGYRLLARVDADGVRLFTRNGHDWTSKLRRVAAAVKALGLPSGWLDGEIVVPDAHGVPDFQLLQNALDAARGDVIQYYLFDLPFFNGLDLRQSPLSERRALLGKLLEDAPDPRVRFSESFDATPQSLLHSACSLHMEGVIGKRADAHYSTGRSSNWIKLKCTQRQEFVVIGYTDPQGSRLGLGALALGVYDAAGKLHYMGNVGTGFTQDVLKDLKTRLEKLHVDKTPAVNAARNLRVNWVKPTLVAEVSFAGWTRDKKIRQGVYHGLRNDKPAKAIVLEKSATVDADGHVSKQAQADGDVDMTQASTTTRASKTAKKTASETVERPAVKKNTPAESATEKPAAKKSATKQSRSKQAATKQAASADSAVPTTVKITHPDRVVDPSSGITKREVVEYYARASAAILPHLQRRPVSLVRAPDGVGGQQFFQKHDDKLSIPGIKQLNPDFDPDHAPLMEVATLKALLGAAQMNVLEFHTWNATTRSIEKPDRMTFDLDPGDGLAWKHMVEGAQLVRALLNELELTSFLKTSGGKGLHVVVPIKPSLGWDAVKDLSQTIVAHLARTIPARFVAKSGPKNRVGKIFADYLRNGRGATTASAWSARARPGMGISVPLSWDELPELRSSDQWTIRNADERLELPDPWADYDAHRNDVRPAIRALT